MAITHLLLAKSQMRQVAFLAITIAVMATGIDWAILQVFQRPHTNDVPLIEITPQFLDMGTLDPGVRKELLVEMKSTTPLSSSVVSLSAGCPCLKISPKTIDLKKNRPQQVKFIFDAKDEPNFHGSLAIEIVGKGQSVDTLLSTNAYVTVR